MIRLFAATAVLLAGCAAYDPPLAGDHAVPRYQTDLQRCRKDAQARADRKANATPGSAFNAIFTSDEPVRQDIRTCMQARGYKP